MPICQEVGRSTSRVGNSTNLLLVNYLNGSREAKAVPISKTVAEQVGSKSRHGQITSANVRVNS